VTVYAGILALLVNLVVAVVVTIVLKAAKTADGVDATRTDDYYADEGDPKVVRGTREVEEELAT
jgi:SSS family solute:Na+ symporter